MQAQEDEEFRVSRVGARVYLFAGAASLRSGRIRRAEPWKASWARKELWLSVAPSHWYRLDPSTLLNYSRAVCTSSRSKQGLLDENRLTTGR